MVARADLTQQSKPLHIENTALVFGKKALNINNAFETYREMKYDGIVSGSMSFIKAVLSRGDWKIVANENSTQEEKKTVKALNKSLNEMKGYTKKRLMSEWLQMLDYGCSISEVVVKRENGKFVFENISPIHLTTVQRFVFEKNSLKELHLNPAENDGLVFNNDVAQTKINGEKILFIRLESDSDFPLGKSLLYGAYTAWKTKKILQEYEAIGVAKNLSGVLDIKVPSEYINKYFAEPASPEAIYVDNMLQQAEMLHAGKGSYILTASDTQENGVRLFEVGTIGNSQGSQSYDVGAAIGRYNQEIQLSLQTTVLSLGANGGGSYNLSDNSTHLMSLFIENVRSCIATEVSRTLRHVWELNGHDQERAPYLEFDEIEPLDWDEFTKGWQRLLQAGGVTPTQDLESFFREQGQAPKADYTTKLDTVPKADPNERTGDKEA